MYMAIDECIRVSCVNVMFDVTRSKRLGNGKRKGSPDRE